MLDVAADDGLVVGDDGQGFQGGFAQAGGIGADQALDPLVVAALGAVLMAVGHLLEHEFVVTLRVFRIFIDDQDRESFIQRLGISTPRLVKPSGGMPKS